MRIDVINCDLFISGLAFVISDLPGLTRERRQVNSVLLRNDQKEWFMR
jgi:hypothetical protein